MKILLYLFPAILFFSCAPKRQMYVEYSCDRIYTNVSSGTINGLLPTAAQNQIKEMLPCFTGTTEEGSNFNCGGGIFYLNHDFYFYTNRDYIEIRKNYDGDFSENYLGLNKKSIEYKFGEPDKISNPGELNIEFYFYKRSFGTMVLKFENERISSVILSANKIDDLDLCL